MQTKHALGILLLLIVSVPAFWLLSNTVANHEQNEVLESPDVLPKTGTESSQPATQGTTDEVETGLADTEDVDLGSVIDTPTQPTTSPSSGQTTPSPTTSPSQPSGISATKLAKHNTKSDCWVAYKGVVYDVTSFLPKHPGGMNSIAKYCGTADEFTAAFNRQHKTKQDSRLAREADVMGDYAA